MFKIDIWAGIARIVINSYRNHHKEFEIDRTILKCLN